MYITYDHNSDLDPDVQMTKTMRDFGCNGVSPGYAAAYLGVTRQAIGAACRKGSLRACKIFCDGKLSAILIDTKSLKAYKELRDLTGDRIPYRARAI